jgi:CRISPR-associated protein Csd2
MAKEIRGRCDFVYLFDCTYGNPNGDPDAGNAPRIDPQNGHGLVSDVCLKRKIRNFVLLTKEGRPPNDIFIRQQAVLNATIASAHKEAAKNKDYGRLDEKTRATRNQARLARNWMCQNFYDVRTFGAVMTTGANAGQVRGPVQISFSSSIDPIVSLDLAITRMAVTEPRGDCSPNQTIGRKNIILYGLYRCHGFVSAHLARDTGFGKDDLELLWTSFAQMWEHDRSSGRGTVAAQKLIIFQHHSLLGNAPAHKLFERVRVQRKSHVEVARSFFEYDLEIKRDNLPVGVQLLELI